jgi:membrane protein YqaA with SNARE-associated domain
VIYELIGVLILSFGLNMIPFASPSNLFIASNAALLVASDSLTLGFVVALGSALAKGVHYLVTFFVGKHLSAKHKHSVDAKAVKIKRWAFPLLFIAAASPIPDEPVVVPLGLMRYNPLKFFSAFFLGKLLITTVGAHLGFVTGDLLSAVIDPWLLVVSSVALTVIVTIIFLKVDVGKPFRRLFKRQCPTN